MALTINTTPNAIDNSGVFNVTTSLVEDSTHVNLRLRADIYHEGIIKATLEKPKGIADFDFSDILKSLTPGLKMVKNTGNISETGSIGSNLITSWASRSGTYTTLTTTGNIINSAICTVVSSLETNAVTMAIGDIFMFYVPNMINSGTAIAFELESSGGGALAELIVLNKGIIIMPTASGNFKLNIGFVGTQNFSGTFYCYKITTNRTTIGGLLTPYFVNYSEVYEDALGATQIGATSKSKLRRYVPAIGDTNNFTEYVLHDNACFFASKTLKNITKFHTSAIVDYEYVLCYFTEFVELELYYSKDGAAYDHTNHPLCYEGWGVVILNVGELFSSITSNLRLYFIERGVPTTITEVITIYPDTSCNNERVVLEFDGLVGGKEYLAFDGLADIEYVTERNYRTGANRNRKPLSFKGMLRQKLETVFKDIANTSYLKSLMISEDVKRLEPSYAVPTEVTIVSDSVSITKGRELFVNQIEIEYAE